MAAGKMNYLVLYRTDSQVYGAASRQIALESAPPNGIELEDKRILFVTYQPDTGELMVHPLDQEEVLNAEIKWPKKKTKEEVDDEEA